MPRFRFAALGLVWYAPGLNAANLASRTMLPSDFDVSFDTWIDSPMVVEAKVSNLKFNHAISTLFIGMQPAPFNRGEKGVSVVQAYRGNYREVGSRREGNFTFEPNRKYRLTSRRIGNRIDLFVDGELYRTVQLAMKTPMPMLSLQGIFGALGGKVYFDNVVVKVPPSGPADMAAVKLVSRFYASEEIKPLVLAKLQQLDESEFGGQPLETRRAALSIAADWFQEEDTILGKIEALAGDGSESADVYLSLNDWIDSALVKSERSYRAAAMCAYRADRPAAAWESLKQSDQLHKRKHGFRNPVDVSIAAMMLWKGTNQMAARDHLRQINQIMLADHWKANAQAVTWSDLARESIDEANADPIYDALSQITWNQQHALLIEGDVRPLADSLAEDAVRIVQREPDDPQYATTTKRQDWIESERIWAMGGHASLKRLTRVDCTMDTSAKTPVATSRFFMQGPNGNFAWIQNDNFRREPDVDPVNWKIAKQDYRIVRLEIGDEVFETDRDGWAKLDTRVDEAKQSENDVELLFSLMIASRLDEALVIAKKLAKQQDTAVAHRHLAEIAQWCGEPETIIRAAGRAIELDAMVDAPPAIRALAAKNLATEKPLEFIKNATARPPKFYRWASTKLLAAGEGGLGSWQPTDDSLIGITQLPTQPELSLDDYVGAIIATREVGYKAETIRIQNRQIDGFPAREFVQRGLGVGRAIQTSGKPTVQRFTLIDRVVEGKGDRFLVFVTAYEEVFDMREAEFEQFLLTMKLK